MCSNKYAFVFKMAMLKFEPNHDVATFLNEDCGEATGYEEMIKYMLRTKYVYAMCAKSLIYSKLIRRFWRSIEVVVIAEAQKVVEGFITRYRMISVLTIYSRSIETE